MSIATRFALGIAVSGALLTAPVSAGGYRGAPNGYGNSHHSGYYPRRAYYPPRYSPGAYYPRGYYNNNGGNVAAALIGGLLVGGLVGAAASSANSNRSAAAPTYPQQPQFYQPPQRNQSSSGQPAYGVPAGPQPDAAATQVDLCARAAERSAQNYGGMARVVSIEGIDGSEANAQVRGTLEISSQPTGAISRAPFMCTASYGEVTGVRLG